MSGFHGACMLHGRRGGYRRAANGPWSRQSDEIRIGSWEHLKGVGCRDAENHPVVRSTCTNSRNTAESPGTNAGGVQIPKFQVAGQHEGEKAHEDYSVLS